VRRLRGVAALLLVVAWLATPGAAVARAETPEAQVERLAADALTAYRGADYNRAVELLTKAYEIRQVPALLYNLAKAYDKLGDLDHAADAYRRFADAADADPKLKAKAEARLLALDEARRKKAATAHAPEAAPSGHVEAPPLVTPTPVTPVTQPPSAVEARARLVAERQRERHRDRLVALGVGVGAVAFLGVAIGLSVSALTLEQEYGRTVDFTRKTQLKSDALTQAHVADGFYPAAGVAAAVAAYFVYRGFRPDADLALAPAVAPHGAALVAAGRF
jgi:tetratricopeptide (TPR) repeat protein